MDHFAYRDNILHAEGVNIEHLAEAVGTPLYVYSAATFVEHFERLRSAFASLSPTICYAVKSCDNLHLLRLLADRGAGMDVVSGGELVRAREAGCPMDRVVYAGVGKTNAEIELALDEGIGYFNIESEAEFENISRIAAARGQVGRAALRINPDVDPKTAHAKTTTGKKESKFGVDIDRARRFFETYGRDKHLKLCALHLHIGSPVYEVEPYVHAIERALGLIADLRDAGLRVEAIDIGGGFGADYQTDQTPAYVEYASKIVPLLEPFVGEGGRVLLEPGRTLSANSGILVTRVQYIKTGGSRTFAIIDSGMHHLIRPTLYESWHFIWPVSPEAHHVPEQRVPEMGMDGLETYDVVGPICETGDYLALGRALPPLKRGDLLAVFSAGAYAKVMSSNYNSMPRPVEVMVDGDRATIIRRRETFDDLLGPEREAIAVEASLL
ncbi:MAG: diaminopimelate decarboxylase [Phycisphaeraceae bacterium]|nr:diaminopimelate decarboxylase [Phycisphaeraceae bacterium]